MSGSVPPRRARSNEDPSGPDKIDIDPPSYNRSIAVCRQADGCALGREPDFTRSCRVQITSTPRPDSAIRAFVRVREERRVSVGGEG